MLLLKSYICQESWESMLVWLSVLSSTEILIRCKLRLSIVYQIPQGRLFINFPSASVECSRAQTQWTLLSLSPHSMATKVYARWRINYLNFAFCCISPSSNSSSNGEPKVEILTHLMIVVLDESHSALWLKSLISV